MGHSRSKTAVPIRNGMRPHRSAIADRRTAKLGVFRGPCSRSRAPEKINLLLSEFRGTCGNYACPYDAFHPLRPLMERSYCRNAAKPRRGKRRMVNAIEGAIDPEPAHPSRLLGQAINNLSLGLIIFDRMR